ncbi:TonB-dependent receptor domain-containing protein [Dyadobacter fanqingshengii]|uniref:TonB-dependent receptor n=1 Tax=Dyadobacter fanqingshengii TaxID=2906443 RepID=A0A9X1PAH5_9BACT|nr:TonB-dependent receptor [Dyadobacter fanqingshengii]MCF0041366.1 TonB-dependent receptor [Dyadobacter fanqingshengii]USJ36912.1 TonB-dependent receptor [Dyadobacter fanqingshengii]
MIFLRLTAFILLISTLSVKAQTGLTVTGNVVDRKSRQPLAYCSVALFNSQDSTLVTGLLTSEKGFFKFENVNSAACYLQLQYIGYSKSTVAITVITGQDVIEMPSIAMDAEPRTLQELNVTAERQTLENKVDRQVYRADKFLSGQGGTAVDILKNTPSVTVNSEGEITLRGSSGFLVLINGKPVQTDAATILNQIPANTIENVEVITSPSARFDPDGKSGIINITTKTALAGARSFSANLQGGLPAVYTYGNLDNPVRFGADATAHVRSEKWDFSVSGNYLRNDIAGQRTGDVNTTIDNVFTSFPSDGERSYIRYNYTARSAVSFTPRPNDTFSAGFYTGYRSQSRRADIVYNNTKTDLVTHDNIGRITYFNSNIARKSGRVTLGNLDYTHIFQNKSALAVSGLVEHAAMDGLTTNINLQEPDRNVTLQSSRNPSKNPLNALRLKIDYSVNIGLGKLETGYQYRNQVQKGNFQYLDLDLETGTFNVVPEFSSHTKVTNQIHSVYGQYSSKQGKLEYTAGLRSEYSTRAFSAGSQETRTLDLFNLFPSLNLQYQLTKSLRARGGYSKRVQRATNSELNPFPEREHSETLESGDPDIQPEFIDLSELGIVKDFKEGSVFATIYNQRIKNVVNRVNSVYNDTILNRIYTNAGLATSWGLETGSSFNIYKWWQIYAGGNLYHYKIKGSLFNQDVQVNAASWVYSVNANTTFKLPSNFQVQASLNYLSERVTAQGEDSRFVTPNLSARKTFLKGKLAATLQWQNVDLGLLGSNRQRITTFGKDFFTTTNYIQETDIFLLNLSYNLNQSTKKAKLPSSEFGEKEF